LGRGDTDIDDRFLPLDPSLDARLGDLHLKVSAFDIGRDGRGEVDISDRLGPFVGQFALLFVFLLLGSCVELLALFGRGGGWAVGICHEVVVCSVGGGGLEEGGKCPRLHNYLC